MANEFLKQVQSVISTRNETRTSKTVNQDDLIYSLVNRNSLNEELSHYFRSVNLPATAAKFSESSPLSLAYPELQQLNVDEFVIANIPSSYYDEIIDGRSVTWKVPQLSGSSLTSTTVVSSTYGTFSKKQESPLLGNNIAFLFSDEINLPNSGTTDGGAIDRSSIESWDTVNYLDRPSAVSYQNLQSEDINTDQRSWGSVDLSKTVTENYPTNTNQGYNYDIPVGFVALDKGLMVITHPTLVDNMAWSEGKLSPSGASNTGETTSDIYWNSDSSVEFFSINISYRTSIICMALPNEFFFTNNPTWNYEANLDAYQQGTNDFDPTFVTEVGLYNTNEELIAISKFDRPKEKGYTGLLTFTIKLDV